MATDNPLYTKADLKAAEKAMRLEMDQELAKEQAVLEQVRPLIPPEAYIQIKETL